MRALSALALALSGAVVAVASPAPEMPLGAAIRAPYSEPQVLSGIEVLNGGVSEGDAAHVKSRARDYALQFIITGRGGEYGVADTLTLRDASGELVSVPDAGPYVLMKVPPGRYTAEADFDGAVERRSVSVDNGSTTVHWNTPKASD